MLVNQRQATEKSFRRFQDNLVRPDGLYGTTTGHPALDEISDGHVPTKITTLAARSGMGKTAFTIQMLGAAGRVEDLGKYQRRSEIIMYSWEMDGSFITDRFVCHTAGVTTKELRYAKQLPEDVRKKVVDAYGLAARMPVKYHHHTTDISTVLATNTTWLEEVHKKSTIEGVRIQPVMVLDYVGMVAAGTKYGNRTYDIGDFLQKLKQHANDTGLAVFLLGQVNRTADGKDKPEVVDISDSQFIEQNSDIIIILDRPEHRKKDTMKDPDTGYDIPSMNRAMLYVYKNRDGELKDKLIHCDIARYKFW